MSVRISQVDAARSRCVDTPIVSLIPIDCLMSEIDRNRGSSPAS